MTRLRLLADDLTGALDSAACFVPLTGRVAVTWDTVATDGPAAVDSGTRDLAEDAAAVRLERFAALLDGGDPAFKKIDSLLRGHVAVELAVCMRRFDHCVLAPAFPFQGRVTRNGRQLARRDGGWHDTGVNLVAQLRRLGVVATMPDAETDEDLDAIVAAGRRLPGRVLWCGTGGLAGALAGRRPVPRPVLLSPVLALIGSDHPVTRDQVGAIPADSGSAVITCNIPPGTSRGEARHHIAEQFAERLRHAARPSTLFITGGETLRDLCTAIGVERLEVDGELAPGVPTSILRGGPWDGQRLVSKSGAFGARDFLAALLGEAR